jgi:RNA recognition motif. (a.k.a. RRM, RBD, or RNP domain)
MVKKLEVRNGPRKGRGYAFVTCADEKLQQRAIIEMDGKEIEVRDIEVKVAIDGPGDEDQSS